MKDYDGDLVHCTLSSVAAEKKSEPGFIGLSFLTMPGDECDLAFGHTQIKIRVLTDALVEVVEELSGFFVTAEEVGKFHSYT